MSLITRCPACATLFRVVPDQLKVADGWVRCGQCAEVFDASSHFQPAFPEATAEPAPITAPAPLEALPDDAPDVAPEAGADPPDVHALERELAAARHRPIDLLLDDGPEPLPEPAADPPPSAPAGDDAGPGDGSRLAPPDEGEPDIEEIVAQAADDTRWPWPPHAAEGLVFRAAAADNDEKPEPALEPDPMDAPGGADAVTAPDAPAQAPGFVRQARRRAFWRSRGARAALSLLSLALAVLLLAQFALHHRNALASLQPELAPLLARLCEPLGCRVGPPRQIEAIVIDGSTFSRLRPDAFRLGLTLRSRSIMALELPALELTLTDADDRPVLRRVLLPADLGPDAPPVLLPGGEWSTALTLGVSAGAAGSGPGGVGGLGGRIAGYRLLAFYP